jgi:succinoglycan biosynthesis protein ExoA
MSTTQIASALGAAHAGAGMMAPPVSGTDILVVIPTLNEAGHIEDCVRSLMTGDSRIQSARVIVADGGSTDGTQDKVTRLAGEFPNVGLLHNPGRLQSAAVNLAARQEGAGRSILVRCDAHSIYPEGYVLAVADALRRHGVESLATPMDAVGDTCFQRANAFIVDTPLGSGGSAHRGGRISQFVDHGHHAGFDLPTFLRLGGYDETFSHNEDGEYDRRLTASGGRIYLDADIRLKYVPRASVGALARQYYNYGRGRARNLMKHGDRPKLRQLIPPAVFGICLLSLLVAPVAPWTLLAPAGYVALLLAASVLVAVRMKSPCGLLAGLASGTMHMAWSAGFFRQMLSGPRRVATATATKG